MASFVVAEPSLVLPSFDVVEPNHGLAMVWVNSEQHHALQQALLVEQIEAERSFLDVLTPEQITALSLRVPVVFDLRFGDGVKLSRSRLLSF